VPSIVIPARNAPTYTDNCLTTTLHSVARMNLRCEFILIDDASEPDENIVQVFARHRANAPEHEFKIVRCRERRHYSGVFSIGLNLASEDEIFFISNDMMVTPSFLETLRLVSTFSRDFGIIRGTSNHTDSLPEHQVKPPEHPKDYEAVEKFSRARASLAGRQFVEDDVLSGDAILVKRTVVDRIGVLDQRFFGYFGDVDYGLRAQLAGFKLVCAKGAWLYHHGAGHVQRQREKSGRGSYDALHGERMALVEAAYQQFRAKWNIATPEHYAVGARLDYRDIARSNAERVALKYELAPPVMQALDTY
jgi:GT2 family glycosyltransferase